ncbi:MAG: hypothetical protein P4L84_17630 [Isosphaeraceae bacterium]|nr:hypothetical protein [Isosphaeraceae bacterium]
MGQIIPSVRSLVAAVLVLAFVAEVHAAVPRGILPQRRGTMFRMPPKPANVDSSATIDTLNKALKALGATDLDYDGHRQKAIAHIGAAIQHLELPNAKGKSNAALEKASSGQPAAVTRTATTPQQASDESLRKAKTALFAVHHKLTDHTASRGHLRADAEVRIAIDEIIAALKSSTATAAAAKGAPPSASTTPPTSTTSSKPAK